MNSRKFEKSNSFPLVSLSGLHYESIDLASVMAILTAKVSESQDYLNTLNEDHLSYWSCISKENDKIKMFHMEQ